MRFLPRSASWDEEMEKRSRRRIRDLVAHPASQGLDANENRCARISMMARSANAPLKGRIQKRKTNNLQIITSGLQRTAGPYRCAISGREQTQQNLRLFDHLVGEREHRGRDCEAERLGGLQIDRQRVLRWLLHRKVARLGALQDAVDIGCRRAYLMYRIGA